jgi:predicted acyltransferase
VGLVFSLDRTILAQGRLAAIRRVVRRALAIYVLGVFYNGGIAQGWANVRWIGVLQEIGACYLVAGSIYCACDRRLRRVATAAVGMLVAHWAVLTFVPFPNLTVTPEGIKAIAARVGSATPSAIAAAVPGRVSGVYDHGHNLANYLDFRFLPGKKPEPLFAWEGLLSPLSAAAVCLAGIFAARLLREDRFARRGKAAWLCLGGLALILLGIGWGFEMPVVKKLWSSSFCLIGAGYGAVMLGIFYQVIDVWGFARWCTPLVWIGANPIAIYVLSGLLNFRQLANRLFGAEVKTFLDRRVMPGLGGLVVASAAFLLILWAARFLYRQKIFLRL